MSKIPVISIIDDDESVRIATESLVRSLGYQARTFASAEAFLVAEDFSQTDCVITDVQMPGMSGPDLQRLLRARGFTLPMIFLTAFPEERIRKRTEADGAVGFFSKPFDGNALIDCLQGALAARL